MKNEKDNFNDTVIKDMEAFLNKKNTLKQLIKKIKGKKQLNLLILLGWC